MGVGQFYGAPFVCGTLLYRLLDLDCSLLFNITNNVAVSDTQDDSRRLFTTTVTPLHSRHVDFHFSSSARTPVAKMLEISANRFEVPTDFKSKEWLLRDVSVSLESWRLPLEHGFFVIHPQDPPRLHSWEGTGRCIQTPGTPVSALSLQGGGLDKAFYQSLRISIKNRKRDEFYQPDQAKRWNLTAIRLFDQQKALYEATLI